MLKLQVISVTIRIVGNDADITTIEVITAASTQIQTNEN